MRFAQKLRKSQIKVQKKDNPVGSDLVLLLDNVYDTFNVGGMYRVGDAANVSKIYHGGATPYVPNSKITRAAVGLDKYIAQTQVQDIAGKITELKNEGFQIIALEQTKTSKIYDQVSYAGKIALVVGNETFGVDPEIIKLCDTVVELPMYGINKSLNVVVATGIILYQIRKQLNS